MARQFDRRRTPDIPRPDLGQRKGDKRRARELRTGGGSSSLSGLAAVLWTAAAIAGLAVGVAWHYRLF
jgi:hypothetical protein